jgi:hypothetical protein
MEAATGGGQFWLLRCFPLIATADTDESVSAYITILDSKKRLLNTGSFLNDQRSTAEYKESAHRLTSLVIIPYLAI